MDVGNGVGSLRDFEETECDLLVDLTLRILESEWRVCWTCLQK